MTDSTDPSPAPASRARLLQVGPEEAGQRLDRALGRWLPGVPLTRIFRLVRKGEVRVNGGRASPEQRLAEGDTVRVPPVRAQSATEEVRAATGRTPVPARLIERVEAAIVHEDDRLLVLDKPSGLAVHGGSGLDFGVIEALRASRPDEPLELVHRLDRDTSGLLMVARRRSALRELHALIREGQVEKGYLVLVSGRWELGQKLIDAPLHTEARVGGERTVRVGAGGKAARTRFRLVQQFGPQASLLEATLDTGRTHQIRVHAAWCRHPVLGDAKYGDAAANEAFRRLGLRRLFLHSHTLAFTWPGGASAAYSAPLPDDLNAVIGALQGGEGKALPRPAVPPRPEVLPASPPKAGRKPPPARRDAPAGRKPTARRDAPRGSRGPVRAGSSRRPGGSRPGGSGAGPRGRSGRR